MRQIVLDTETTGLLVEQGHRLIEIGCIELVDRKITGKHFHRYINPLRDIEEGARNVHGISNEFLQDKPVFVEIAQDFVDFIKGAELIIHNAPFDVGFINHELSLVQLDWTTLANHCRILDTLVLARKIHVGQRNSLDALCKRYSIDLSQREYHGALLDANLLAQVYLAMTGGQGSLFGESSIVESPQQPNKDQISQAVLQQRNLCVIPASAEELQEHEQYLQMLAKQGKCLWLN